MIYGLSAKKEYLDLSEKCSNKSESIRATQYLISFISQLSFLIELFACIFLSNKSINTLKIKVTDILNAAASYVRECM